MAAALKTLVPALLSFGTVVCAFLGPPCMSPLGLQYGISDSAVTFDLAASSGDASNIRMDGPKSWRPASISGSFIEINISQPVLLTALQVQGDPQQTGQISGWLLDTSQDCESYRTENYTLNQLSPVYTQTVHLKHAEFVTCVRLRPTHFKGKSPALRLELLGCVIEDSSVCDRDVHPVTEVWMESGGRQLTFLHEIVISWIKVLLDHQVYGDTGDAGIFYSRSCDQWHYYMPSDTSVMSVTSADQATSWMTIDMDKPVRAKCLRIFPPFSTTLKEVHTSGCSAHVTTSLHETQWHNNTKSYEKDIAAYQEDAPNVSHNGIHDEDDESAKRTLTMLQKKEKMLSENTRTNVKSSQKQTDIDKTGAAIIIPVTDSELQVTRTSVEISATSTTTIHGATEDITTSPQTATEIKTLEDGLAESSQKPGAASLATTMNNNESIKDNRQHVTQSNEVNYHVTRLSDVYDKMATQQTTFTNANLTPKNVSDVGVVTDAQESTKHVSTKDITIDINEDSNNINTTLGSEIHSNGGTADVLDKSVDGTLETAAAVQHIDNTSSMVSLDMGTSGAHQLENSSPVIRSENNSLITQAENNSSVIQSENNSLITQAENNSSVIQSENNSLITQAENNSSVIQSENNSLITQAENNSSVIQSENNSLITQAENNSLIIRSENNSSVTHTVRHNSHIQYENNSSAIRSDNNNSVIHFENNSSIIHSENDSSNTHTVRSNSNIQSENDSSNITSENDSSIVDSENNSSILHSVRINSSIQSDRTSSDTNDWWRSDCGIKGWTQGYRKKRVVSGHRNTPGEWPWLISMHFLPQNNFTDESGFKHLCGASLIAPNWILTAAHCFADYIQDGLSNLTSWRIYFGMHDLAREDNQNVVQERLVEAIYSYPEYNVSVDPLIYDIALVKLNEPVEYNERVSPVCLDDTYIHYEEIPCYVSGWGQLFHDSPGSRFPYTAPLSTLSPSMCKGKYDVLPEQHPMKPFIRIQPPVLCARVGTSGEDACQGDSGGPLMCQHDGRWYQAGVVAAGYLCGNEATPGLYSRVSYYFDWIRQTMADNDDIPW